MKIINARGTITEVKIGEGKSFIIFLIAIVLILYYRLFDVVLLIKNYNRDENDQGDYYQLFNNKNGVLVETKGDKDFFNLIRTQIIIEPEKKIGYNLEYLNK